MTPGVVGSSAWLGRVRKILNSSSATQLGNVRGLGKLPLSAESMIKQKLLSIDANPGRKLLLNAKLSISKKRLPKWSIAVVCESRSIRISSRSNSRSPKLSASPTLPNFCRGSHDVSLFTSCQTADLVRRSVYLAQPLQTPARTFPGQNFILPTRLFWLPNV